MPTLLGVVGDEARRYEVTAELTRPGENGSGYDVPYYFWISGCWNEFCGRRTRVGPVYPWVRERAGWPKLLGESSVCAPSVVPKFDGPGSGTAILAATDRIYGWWADGSPINPTGSEVLFDPQVSPRARDQRFTEALAVGNWYRYDFEGMEIAGNLSQVGTYFIGIRHDALDRCCVGELVCSNPGLYSLASPMVGKEAIGASDSQTGVFLRGCGPEDGGNAVYSWPMDLNGIYNQTCGTNVYAQPALDASSHQYQSLAIGHPLLPTDTAHQLITVSRNGTIESFPLSTIGATSVPANWEWDLGDGWLSMGLPHFRRHIGYVAS